MITKKGWATQIMFGAFKKEASFNAGVTMNSTNACSMQGFEAEVSFPDVVANDKDEITGTEFGTTQEIIETRVDINYKEAKAKPNSLAFLSALVLGNIVSTQDGALAAYRHKMTRVAAGTALPSTQAEFKMGGLQYAAKGIKGKSLKISASEAGFVSLEAALMGAGGRDTSATAFVPAISESWMKVNQAKFFMEDGATISIAGTLTQGLQNISSGTPADLSARFKNLELSFDNSLEGQPGSGGAGIYQDIDYGRRKADLKFSLLANDVTELNHYFNQDVLAVEFDIKGALIAATGTMYYGGQIIVPRFKLKAAPWPKGGANDILTIDMEADIQDDGTNSPVIIEAYTAKAAYLAA